jgi:hypothetical protein
MIYDDRVDFVLDLKNMIDYFNNGSNNIIDFGYVLSEFKRYCNLYFENSYVEFSPRQTNKVPHNLVPV